MKNTILSLAVIGTVGLATAASAADFAAPPPPAPLAPAGFLNPGKVPPVVVQFGPTTNYSTIVCPNFAKAPDGTWVALNPQPYSLGFVQGIIPPIVPIKSGGFIYNNIDLYSQLELQCGAALVRARY